MQVPSINETIPVSLLPVIEGALVRPDPGLLVTNLHKFCQWVVPAVELAALAAKQAAQAEVDRLRAKVAKQRDIAREASKIRLEDLLQQKRLLTENESLRIEITELRRCHSEIGTRTEQVAAAKTDACAAQARLDELDQQLVALQTQTAEAATKASEAAAQCVQTKAQVTAAERSACEAHERQQTLQQELASRRTVKQTVQADVSWVTRLLESCNESTAQASQELSAKRAELASVEIAIAAAAEEAASLRLQLRQAVEDESKAESLLEWAKRMLSDSFQEVSETAGETERVTQLSKLLVHQLGQFRSLLAAELAAHAQLEADHKVLEARRRDVAHATVAANAKCSVVRANIDSATRAAADADEQCTALAVELATAVQAESARATELGGLKAACRRAELALLTVAAETDAARWLLRDLTEEKRAAGAARQLSQHELDLAAGAAARARTAAAEVAALVAPALAARDQAEAALADARHRLAGLKEECAAAGKGRAAVMTILATWGDFPQWLEARSAAEAAADAALEMQSVAPNGQVSVPPGVCLCLCVCVRARVCVCACAYVCVWVVCVCASV